MPAKKEYCVWTVPPGQLPARMVKCFKTKKAAQRYTHRERYLQIIPRAATSIAGRRRRRDAYCHVGYEVAPLSVETHSGKMIRKVFSNRAEAKTFKRQHPGAVLRVVEVCDGKIVRRGKRQFSRAERR